MSTRQFSEIDRLLSGFGKTLETLFADLKHTSNRNYPAEGMEEASLTDREKRHAAGLMRVNHVGEICAQALYQSQALTARDEETRGQMKQSAEEEADHLAWCEQRIKELGGRKSLLNPLWYAGSFAIGTAAGIAGDKWNLGFVAETENQVVDHLEDHLGKLPEGDEKSRKVVSQMQTDEAHHGEQARQAGAEELPPQVKRLMKCASGVMTRTAYWI